MKKENDILPNLFRSEFSKMVAVVSKLFGLEHIEVAEDIVSEAFLKATENWREGGIPANPTAWLYTVAKNNTLHYLRKNKLFAQKIAPEVKKTAAKEEESIEPDFSGENIRDSQLQMLFAVCDPVIASEAQIGLALRILCGFSIDEIAEAFLTNKETINKRLFRAKEKLRQESIKLEMPPDSSIGGRVGNVLHIIYLLFNEGYYSVTHNQVLRKDLCLEALRLGLLLTEYPKTNLPVTNALIALMCYHSSRFAARQGSDDTPILYEQQDEGLWDQELISRGDYYLRLSAEGPEITSYHLEAGIAHWHCQKEDTAEKWDRILQLYDLLLQTNYSPSVALNRIYALYKVKGREVALAEAQKLNLSDNHFYFMLLGELYQAIDNVRARENFEKAYSLARTQTDKQVIMERIGKTG